MSSACYAIRVITPFMSETTLRMIYYSYVHSIMVYGIIFWGNLPLNNVIFKAQKRIIRTMTNSSNSASCRQLFKRLGILPLQSQYIFSVVRFVVKNKELFTTNQERHGSTTRTATNIYPPLCNLTLFQKGAYYSGLKLFNHLPQNIKILANEKKKTFKSALKRFLTSKSFYSVEEYFEHRDS
jgi:hypothetical protein